MRKITSLTFLFVVGLFGLLPAQTDQRKPLPTGELEKYEDPPMYIWRTGSSPRMISRQGSFTSYQVNVGPTGENIVGDAANECSITIDPTNPAKMAIGWRQFDSVASNFRKGGFAYTTNGGTSWTFPGSLSTVFRSDPVLFSTDTGTFYYLSLISGFRDDIWRSINGGQSWVLVAPAKGGDKQWFTIDNTNSSGRGFQYQFWSPNASDFGTRQFTRSIDGGINWSDPINIPNAPQWGTLDVNSNGDLFIGGMSNQRFWCIRSTDARNSKAIPSFDRSTEVEMAGAIGFQPEINPEGLAGQVFLAVDRSGTSTNNNIYMLASLLPDDFTARTNVMFAKSTDGGATFSAPRKINDDPVNPAKWHWFGALSVAPNGRIDVVWLDSRNAANNTDSQLYYSFSSNGGDTWSPNVAVSTSFDPFIGYPNQNKIGDYMTVVSDNGGANVAYPATFNQEEDIYFVHIDPSLVPTPTPTPTPTPSPSPSATATITPGPTIPPPPTATPTPSASSQAVNLSTRMQILTGDNVGIGGFIITGAGTKHVLIRAIGPSLGQFGVADPLANPVLELHGPGSFVTITNDNWKDDPVQRALIEATGLQPSNDFESAIEARLDPGSYTAVASGKNSGVGVGLIEVYDLAPADPSKLGNISTRAWVSNGSDIVIAGFIIGGNSTASDRVIIRAIGPSLASVGVSSPLANPKLELRDSNGSLIVANNDWRENPAQEAELTNAGLAPVSDVESGIAVTLPPGLYTALLSGVNNSTGVGLIEVYDRGQ
jgi:hypothetical protein